MDSLGILKWRAARKRNRVSTKPSGFTSHSRHCSQFLALQLKARMEGIDTPVYELAASHHRR